MRGRGQRYTPLIAALGALAALGAPSAASAAEPWWHLNTTERPAGLQQPAASEVQEIVANVGKFGGAGKESAGFELFVGGKFVGVFATEPIASEFGVPVLTAAELQKALEGTEFYGPGNVKVAGPEGTAPLPEPPAVDEPLKFTIT